MGTRSLTFVYDNDEVVVNMYAQYDGYPEGHGKELADFLVPLTLTNGFSGDTTNLANGMGCLAAQLIARFKVGCGGHYLYPADARDCGQDYEYHVHDNRVVVKNHNGHKMFDGNWKDFAKFCSATEVA